MAAPRPIDARIRAQVIALIDEHANRYLTPADIPALRSEFIMLARQSSDSILLAEALLWRFMPALRLEPREVMNAALEEARRLYAGAGIGAGLAHCDALQAMIDALEGRYAQALFTLRRAIPLLKGLRDSMRARANALDTLAYVCFSLSMHEDVIRAGVSLVELAKASGFENAFDRGTYLQLSSQAALAEARISSTKSDPRDDREMAELLARLEPLANEEEALRGTESWMYRVMLMEILYRLGREEQAAAIALRLPVGDALIGKVYDSLTALLLHGPQRCIELIVPMLEPADRMAHEERRSVLEVLAIAYERTGNHRAALHATRESLALRHSDASRKAKAQAALFGLELEAERETLRAQQALAHAGKLAAVGQLASSLAHDISQPAAALMLLCDEARAELKAQRWPALAECLQDTEAQVRRLSKLVERMNDFSRDDPVHIEKVSLDQIAEEAHRLLRPKLREAGVACKVEVPALIAMTDRERVILALVNLINNAVDAMRGQRSPAPEVRIVAQQHDSGEVRLSVLDNGPGLSDEVKTKVFQPFFTTKAAGQGLGLGLTITRQALTDLGARLQADNAEGGGARFTVCLPASADEVRSMEALS
jgi:signal transduction histidine kinase